MTERRRFRRENGLKFIVNASTLVVMLSYRQRTKRDTEAGGVLLGRELLDAPHIIVDEVTVPMKGDRRWLKGFWRAQPEHQRIIDERWAASGGTCKYLGEWHTHPESVPHASLIDRLDWRRRLAYDTYDVPSLFFVIVGTTELRAWEGTREGKLTQLTEEPRQDR
ncbi:MAG TPA: Mov34/MPN/PAD-1 family protein [Polyangiaceae bacterium]|nr:Mov34/MPN/PAD-1 family protein [Polyangiaceae bacterium]